MSRLQQTLSAHGELLRRRGVSAEELDSVLARTTDSAVVDRYRSNFRAGADSHIGIDEVCFHLDTELRLTTELLDSSPETRWETADRCYTEFYRALPWLAGVGNTGDDASQWLDLIGVSRPTVYEVGSGSGGRAKGLAELGCSVVATEITRERGGSREPVEGVTWGITDGVNLDDFTSGAMFDAVVSDQVVEHLHPDDIGRHLRGASSILTSGGKYVVRTPNASTGPSDIGKLVGFPRPIGLHLKEYTFAELGGLAMRNGFSKVEAVTAVPVRGGGRRVLAGSAYFRWLTLVEHRLLRGRRVADLSPAVGSLMRPPIFQRGLWLVLHRQ